MKQIYISFFTLLFIVCATELSGQVEYNMPIGGNLDIEDCAGILYDSGGPDGNYSDNESGTVTINPPGDNLIAITINFFDSENSGTGCFDELFIYDGEDTGAPLFSEVPGAGWCWDSTDNPPNGSGNPTGLTLISSGEAVTFQFTSDVSVTRAGFEISFGCFDPESVPVPSLVANPPLTCEGTVNFSNGGAEIEDWELTYAWDFGDGNTSMDATPTHTYVDEGSYDVSLEICNQFGCTDTTFVALATFDTGDASCFEITMPQFDSEEFTGCSATLFDSGGPDGDAVFGNEATYTIYADEPNSILVLEFVEFAVSQFGDMLTIYDGEDTSADVIAFYDGTEGNLPDELVVTSGDAVTVQFQEFAFFNANYEIAINCLNTEIAPEPEVEVDQELTCDGTVTFSNIGIEAASWELTYAWDFGDGNTSTDASPTHTYINEGTYDVTVEVCNDFGCNEVTANQVVTFDSEDASCFEIIMPSSGFAEFIGCSATLFDSGGPLGPATFNDDATYTIYADDQNSIMVVEFIELNISQFGDFLAVYDGPDTSSDILAAFDGTIPPTGPVFTTADVVTIQFQEFAFFNANFELAINCLNTETAPEPEVGVVDELACSGTANFFNQGIEAASWDLTYNWDFGDGNTSTDPMPSHTYTDEGAYDVTVEVCNQFGCNEVTAVEVVTFDSQDPSCFEFTMPVFDTQVVNSCNGTLFDSGGEFSSAVFGNDAVTTIAPGGDNLISLDFTLFQLSFFNGDLMTIYDGPDVNSPVIAVFDGVNSLPNGPLVSSGNSITIQFQEFAFFNADYVIEFVCIPVVDPPVAAISSNPPYFTCDGIVEFGDISSNAPSSWEWDFGDGNTSTDENPSHTYTEEGSYEVSLIACNNLGCDTTTMVYEFLFDNDPVCFGETMFVNEEINVTECTGILYDSGGPNGPYLDSEFSTVVLGATGAGGVTLIFTEFSIGGNFDNDVVNIYDGEDSNAPLIGSFSGTFLPNFGEAIVSSSSYLTVELISDAFTPGNGFTAYWNVEGGTVPPEAAFGVENLTPPYGVPVQFTDLTTELPTSWFWDFGDGDNAFAQNPFHTYTTSGEQVVTLTASNCVGSDEAESITVNVQGQPIILVDGGVNPPGYDITIDAGQTLDTTLLIQNFGGGDLYYEIEGFENTFAGLVQILAYDFGGNIPTNADVIPNIQGIINDNLTGVTFNTTSTTSVTELEELLENTNIFLVAGQSGADLDTDVMSDFAPILQDFVDNGGTVLFMATQRPDMIFNTGLMDGTFELDFDNEPVYNVLPYYNPNLDHDGVHPILEDVEKNFEGKSGCLGLDFTDPDINILMVESGFDVIGYREQGDGKVVYLGFNYYQSNEPMKEILINTILWSGTQENAVQWLYVDPSEGILEPGSAFGEEANITFFAVDAPGGTYTANLLVSSNDPNTPQITIPVSLTIVGTPAFDINTTELDFGNVIQFTTEDQQVTITNTGTDSLFITDIIFPSADFTADITAFGLYPTLTQNINITFGPDDIATLEDQIMIVQTNVGDFEVLIDANVTGAPVSVANPTPVEITVGFGETNSADLTLSNLGLGFLEYELESQTDFASGYIIEVENGFLGNGFHWEILDSDGNIVLQTFGFDYPNGNTVYTETVSALDPCEPYTLVLFDDFNSIASYSVTNELTGDVLSSGNSLPSDGLEVALAGINPSWLSFDNVSGQVEFPDGEENVSVTVNPDCLLGGVYETTIFVNSNDPITPVVEVPVIMTVVGTPMLELINVNDGDELDFGSILIGLTSTQEIELTNPGSDDLIISGFVIGDEQFSVSPDDVNLSPNEIITLIVTFEPDAITDNETTLTIISNAGEYEFDLIGAGQGAPIVEVTPNSIDVTLLSGDSESVDITLSNSGAGPLEYEVITTGETVGFLLEFTTDNFPGELIWSLTDSDGNEVAGMPSGTYTESGTLYTETVSGLEPSETYTLLIEDSYIGCDGAVDAYVIYDLLTGGLIESGGEVGSGDCQYFTEIGSPEGIVINSGEIDFPGEDTISILVDAAGLVADIYPSTIFISTNDPLNPTIAIPLTLNVIAFPQANFSTNADAVVCGIEQIQFFDMSINVPTNWAWDFGDGEESTLQNPTHTYQESGSYDVTLIAWNDVGADTLTIEDFVIVDTGCEIININATGIINSTACNGQLYDSGGPGGTYGLNSSGIVTIAPPNAGSVTLTFDEFVMEPGIDFIQIYDGPDTNSPLIGEYSDMDLAGETITSTGSSITIVESSDLFFSASGFTAFFSCTEESAVPVAIFSVDADSPCSGNIEFTDESTGVPTTWEWDFGDGNSSTEEHPNHQYEESGTYMVSLTATNDLGTDTSTEEIEVYILTVEATIPEQGVADEPISCTIDNFQEGWNTSWNYGDGSAIDNSNNGTYTYTNIEGESDTFTVSLTVIETVLGDDCSFLIEQDIIVFAAPPPPTTTLTLQVETGLGLIEVDEQGMFVIGSFTDEPIAMTEIATDLYSVTVEVEQNQTYFYQFVNGTEVEVIPDDCGTDDGSGTMARSVAVGEEAVLSIDPICFSYCQVCILDGIQEIPNAQLSIAPNPSNGYLNYQLEMDQISDLQLTITNAIGEEIHRDYLTNQANYQQRIDLNSYPNGLYWVRFTNNNQQLVKPFVLQH